MTTSLTDVSVPFLDLRPSHEPIRKALMAQIGRLIDEDVFINGADVAAFEDVFAAYCGTRHGVGMASGLDALRLCFMAAGLEPGDEVVLPAMTFIATAEAVTQAGGVPAFVDISDEDYGLDVTAVEDVLTPSTRFVCPVHLYGQLSDMRSLAALADRHDLQVVEDACQAHGAERDGLRAGTVGIAAAFSFYPGKNLGAMGDAGALVTDDDSLADAAIALREHGQRAKYVHEREGYTARLDTIQALILLLKLPLLDRWNQERADGAAFYQEALDGVGDLVLPTVPSGSSPVWHRYVVRTREPQRLAEFLQARGIGTARNYPQALHLMPAYAQLGHAAGAFPLSEQLAAEALSLPLYPGIDRRQLDHVAASIGDFFGGA